ncbi:MAG TPA: branched-chain amino acid ABC transporter permease, partial [Thermoleophilaceae bacterium]|nr:branched-chain amino acid ABC transporter permease [Thermoleophilaceae bacterium]
LPQYAEGFWLQTGLFAMSAAIAAIGLTLLVGVTGQLSLASAFFIAIGAYGYCYLAGESGASGGAITAAPDGLGWPPWLAAIGAVLLAGVAGALFSPIAGRLKGIYLGLASIGLVFIGQHILQNATSITGGFNGRDAKPFSLLGFHLADDHPDNFSVFGVPYGQLERLWYLGLVLVLLSAWYARNLLRARPGRALEAIRDSEVAAAVMGVNVARYRAAAFTVSSMYAGLAGVFLALAFGRVVPESFGFLYSIDFLVMIVIGGLGSVGGAVVGAVIVTALPQVLLHYADRLPLVAAPGSDGLQPGDAARFLYGAAVVAVLIFASDGLAGLTRRLEGRQANSKESTS